MKIGVHLHLYYLEQWEFFKKQLDFLEDSNIKIIITTSKEKLQEAKIEIGFYDMDINNNIYKIYGLENRGYDVAPFIFALNKLKSWEPDVVLKLQTKGHKNRKTKLSLNGLIFKNATEWRNRQVNGLLGNRRNINKILNRFENPKIGLIGGYEFLHLYFEVNRKYFDKFNKIFKDVKINKPFFAGTMFWIRWEICEFLIKKLKFKDFNFVNPKTFGTSKECDTMAHAFEHGINSIADFLGFKTEIIDCNFKTKLFVFWRKNNPYSIIYKLFKRFCHFVYYKKITNKNKILIKICKIPIYSKLLIK